MYPKMPAKTIYKLLDEKDSVFSMLVDRVSNYVGTEAYKPLISDEINRKHHFLEKPVELFYSAFCERTNSGHNIKVK